MLFRSGRARCTEPVKLTENGSSAYTICLPSDTSTQTAAAAEMLRQYIEKVSGAKLPIVETDSHSGNRIVFEIGKSVDTSISLESLGEDGFCIKTAGRDLFFTAQTARGVQNAVYTFIEAYLGCRKYSLDFEVIPHTPTIVLPSIDDTDRKSVV